MANDTQINSSSAYTQDLLANRFINSPLTIVSDTVSAILNTNPNVGVLNHGNVIICRDYAEKDVVKIVSGGPSGHEPAHAGFVGIGMLTAAIQGEIFQTPFISEIINAIKEISFKLTSGVLAIIQNNTSDRLSFGLAVERARNQGIDVKLLLVTDEFCVINERQGRRGLTGIILVNKIAGALAEREFTLEKIYKYCKLINENMSTILFSLKSSSGTIAKKCICTKKMKEFELEVGAGLHGEEGITMHIEQSSVKNTCNVILNKLTNHFPLNKSEAVILMINNLGKALTIEELTVVNEVVNYVHQLDIHIARLYYGKFLTSLDMEGFSVTILRVTNDFVVTCLDDYCEATGWGFVNQKPVTLKLQEPIVCRVSKRKRATVGGPRLNNEQANIVFHVVQFGCDALISCEKQLNTMDADGGAGNVGTKIKRGAQDLLLQMQRKTINFFYPRRVFETLSDVSEKKIAGGIGALYGIFFEAAANYFMEMPEDSHVYSKTWLQALQSANAAIKSYGNIEFGLGTMYDPLHACAETLEQSLENQVKPLEAFDIAVSVVEDVVLRSKTQFRKHVDPGARVVGIWMRAMYEGLQLRFE